MIYIITQRKKIQFQISHIDSKDIININGKKSNDDENTINIVYKNLQITKGFPTFSIIDKKIRENYKKINVNNKIRKVINKE